MNEKRGKSMKCPSCEEHVGWDWIEDEAIEPNEEFECPECDVTLMYAIDEGTYYGAEHKTVEVVDN
jgi:DNA-directed RNA polymerase subunit RPC12/RpoP